MRQKLSTGLSSLLLLLLSVVVVTAQSTCPALVELALDEVGLNCDNLSRNVACYGYNRVNAGFVVPVDDDFFNTPADTATLTDVDTIATAAMDINTGEWGVAVLNIQANLPDTLPGQNVTFVLFGDAELQNDVTSDEVFENDTQLRVTTNVRANIRSGASTRFNTVGIVDEGTGLIADGLSPDEQWLRVVYGGSPAWVNREVIADNSAIDDLPTLTSDLRTSMQAFYLSTGIGQPQCEEAPQDGLLVESPEGTQVTLEINGAEIRIGSLIYFRQTAQDVLEATVLRGTLETVLDDGTTLLANMGETVEYGLDNENTIETVERVENVPLEDFCNITAFGNILRDADPCGTTTTNTNTASTGAPTVEASNTNPSQLTSVDCSAFNYVAPLQIAATNITMQWTEAVGADSYILAFFDQSGVEVGTLPVGNTTNVEFNAGQIMPPTGYVDIRAYRAGEYACFTRYDYVRAANPNESVVPNTTAPIGANLSVAFNCINMSVGQFTWVNLPAGHSLQLKVEDIGGFVDILPIQTAATGSQVLGTSSGTPIDFAYATELDPFDIPINTFNFGGC